VNKRVYKAKVVFNHSHKHKRTRVHQCPEL